MNYPLMKRCLHFFLILLIALQLIFLPVGSWADDAATTTVESPTPQALQDAINQKSKQLQDIINKINENKGNLQELQTQSQTLKKEIKKLDYNINIINLNITQSQVTIDQLGLQIDALGYTVGDTQAKIQNQEQAIVQTIQEIQQKEGDTPLLIFLKNKSLSDSVFEAQSLVDLNHGLSLQIQDLKNSKEELVNQLTQKSDLKDQVQQQNQNMQNQRIILADTKQSKQTLLQTTKDQEQVYQKSIGDLEAQQAAIEAEIEKIDEQLRLKINPSLLPTKRQGVLGLPVDGRLTQGYGYTNFARRAYRSQWHNGFDLAAPIGTPVYAAEKGIVIAVANQDLYCYRGAYGKFIAIQHNDLNLTTIYAHLSLQVVHPGNTVQRGTLIGYVGKTGYATGPHVHFGVYATQTFYIGPSKFCGPQMPYGGDIDPGDYLPSLTSSNINSGD